MTSILGIINLNAESYLPSAQFPDSSAAVKHALGSIEAGAAAVDLGPSPSHLNAPEVAPEIEIQRLAPVLDALLPKGISISVDSFHPQTQRYAISRGVDFINDVRGFAHPEFYPELAEANCQLIVMHNVHGPKITELVLTDPKTIISKIFHFFDQRLNALNSAGIESDRLILDPGMGFFLSSEPEASLVVLQHLADLRAEFDLPVLVSVSTKSFIRKLTGKTAGESGFGTLSTELFAASQGVDWIRTHNVGALRDGLLMQDHLTRTISHNIQLPA